MTKQFQFIDRREPSLEGRLAQAVEEVGNIAEQIAETPIYFKSSHTREGVEAMIQAAAAFAAAQTVADRADAALWIGEAYLIFSASLPDTGFGEKETSWATANQIAKILGGPMMWEQQVRSTLALTVICIASGSAII